jgi:D-sedoheptulose 7-phosphate isomerase
MMGRDSVRKSLYALSRLALEVADELGDEVEGIGHLATECLRGGGRLFFCGNGGSAADAQHLAAEYVVRFDRDREALPAIALTTDTSILTAGGNDFGFDAIFSRQVEALASEGDVLFLHSTSGESENLLRAAEAARGLGVTTVAFLAKGGGRLAGMVDRSIVVPTGSTARAQEIHLALGHAVCELVERSLLAEPPGADADGGQIESGGDP